MGHEVNLKHILKEIGQTLISPKVLFAVAAMLSSDFWLVFIGSWNASHFTLRTRSLNSFCYWILQIPVAYGLSKVLDRPGWSPRKRGTVGFCEFDRGIIYYLSRTTTADSLSSPLHRYPFHHGRRLLGRSLELAINAS